MSNAQNNDNLSAPSARKMAGIIDVHSHIITNLGSQAPMDKLPPWSIEQSLSIMDANFGQSRERTGGLPAREANQ